MVSDKSKKYWAVEQNFDLRSSLNKLEMGTFGTLYVDKEIRRISTSRWLSYHFKSFIFAYFL